MDQEQILCTLSQSICLQNNHEKKSNFIVKKSEGTSLFKWSKLTSTVVEQINIIHDLMDALSQAQNFFTGLA